MRTDTYFDLVTKATRATEGGQAQGEGTSTPRAARGSTCPRARDLQRMREQLSRMERRINQLTEEVTERDGAPRSTARRTRPVD